MRGLRVFSSVIVITDFRQPIYDGGRKLQEPELLERTGLPERAMHLAFTVETAE